MTYRLTISASAMRDINRSAILEIIRRESPIARSTIAQRLDVSLPTVMRIVDGLIDEGFVRLHGGTEWSGGRRRPLLEFNAEGYLILGVDMGGTKMYGALSDLGGNVLDEMNITRHSTSGEDSFNHLTTLIDTLLEFSKVSWTAGAWHWGRCTRHHFTQRRHCHLGEYVALERLPAQTTVK